MTGGGEQDRVAVARQGEIVHRQIRRLEHRAPCTRRLIVDIEIPAVRLEAWPALGADDHQLAVRREGRLGVRGRIGRQLLRGAARHRYGPDVIVGRPGFAIDALAVRDEDELLAVRRESNGGIFGLGWRRIEVARRQVARLATGERRHEHVVADVLPPLVPVPVEQAGQMMDIGRRVGALLHVGNERDHRTVRRNHHRRLHAPGHSRELPDVAAVGVGDVDLRIAVARGDESDVRPVRVPAGRVLALLAADQQPRRGGAVRRHHPDVSVSLTAREVCGRAHERDLASVRRQLRIRHANRRQQILDGQGPRRGDGGGERKQRGRAGRNPENGCHRRIVGRVEETWCPTPRAARRGDRRQWRVAPERSWR